MGGYEEELFNLNRNSQSNARRQIRRQMINDVTLKFRHSIKPSHQTSSFLHFDESLQPVTITRPRFQQMKWFLYSLKLVSLGCGNPVKFNFEMIFLFCHRNEIAFSLLQQQSVQHLNEDWKWVKAFVDNRVKQFVRHDTASIFSIKHTTSSMQFLLIR